MRPEELEFLATYCAGREAMRAREQCKVVGGHLDDEAAPTKIVMEFANGQTVEAPFDPETPINVRLEIWESWAKHKRLK